MNGDGYKAYQEAHAGELSQEQLILMMYSGAIHFLNRAIDIKKTNKDEMEKCISRAKNIILELMASLNLEDSEEMATLLLRVYKNLFTKLIIASINGDVNKIIEVRDALIGLKESWIQVFGNSQNK